MAKKMISDRDDGVVELAPRAMPSARAWMQRPSVVARERGAGCAVGGEGEVDRSERE